MPPPLRSSMGNEALHGDDDTNEVSLVQTRPNQEDQINIDGEESRAAFLAGMNSSEAQFGQDHQDHSDHQPEPCGQHLANTKGTLAFIHAPESQVGQQHATDTIPQDQMQWAHDGTHFRQKNNMIRSLQDEILQQQMQLEEYARENTELKTYVAGAEKRIEDAECRRLDEQQLHRRDVGKLQACIGTLESQIRGLKAQVVSYEAEKSKNKAIANSRKISDSAIKSSWRTMAYNIQSLVTNILPGCPSQNDLNHHGHEGNEKSCAVCHFDAAQLKLLQDDDVRPSVVEKLVWDAVTRRILNHDTFGLGKSWAGAPGSMLSILFNSLLNVPWTKSNPSKLLRWKAESAAMIDRALGIDDKELDKAVSEESMGLRKFIPRGCPNSKTARHDLYQGLREIFKEAIEIHRVLMQSRAHFYLDQVETPATRGNMGHYNPEFHEAEVWGAELSEKSTVILGISPSLVKVGNADGGNYDKHNRLTKASVICD
ncbi:hypothetical protein CT0861_03820 [Colletotrichum tofieldiae]|uniref:Uncharacterized protein n=1 Tax=Colletotrichum tofieldiae TaxID=708197 RepID=A0A166R307_9PEZI|nr:hypothetical protein CT0861_03820 [Colletotrichum tofieldiae]